MHTIRSGSLASVLLLTASACGGGASPSAGSAPIADAGSTDVFVKPELDGGNGQDSAGKGDSAPGGDGGGATVAFHVMDVSTGGGEITETFDTDAGAVVHEVLVGDVVDVRLTGLAPASAVEIFARSYGDDGSWYEADATFSAAADGTVDVASTSPSSGTYSGADPDGLIWSGQLKPESSDATANPATYYFRAEVGGATVATYELSPYVLAQGITQTNVSANGLVGVFYAPAQSGTRGAVIAFGGSEGGLSTGQFMAAYFASLGYPALGVAYFGAPGLPTNLASVPLEYFQTAHDWLVQQGSVDPKKIAVWGASRGGELALLLGATFPWVTAVVAEEPSGVLWGDDDYGDPTYNTASWSYEGSPLPFIPTANEPPQLVTLSNGTMAYAVTPLYEDGLNAASASLLAAATTHVENTAGPVMMTAGADDQLDPSCQLAGISLNRLIGSGHANTNADQFTCYPGAGHNACWGPPGVPTASEISGTEFGEVMAIGGDAPHIALAQRDVDTRLRMFLAANLK